MSRLPLDLYVVVETADGARYNWDANQAPGSRLRNASFRTRIGEGFSDGQGQLARRIDLDYPDLGLLNTVSFVGADGSVAYEGRIEAMPREVGDTHSIGVMLAGWMAHAKERKFCEIYVDRLTGRWGPMPQDRRAALVNANNFGMPVDPSIATNPDGTAAVQTSLRGTWAANMRPISEAWYDAGPGCVIGSVKASWAVTTTTTINTADVNWVWDVILGTDSSLASFDTSGNLRAAGPGAATVTATTSNRRIAYLQLYYSSLAAAGSANADYGITWTNVRVFGDHDLTARGTAPNEGFYASDMVRDIAQRWCPLLDTSGVQDTTHVIEQAAFHERTFPYDALLELNKYHLWHLGVWENKRLDFRPYDLTDYDWEIRTDDQGTTFSPQGPSTETLFNGIAVTYQDILTGATNTLTPDDSDELRDTSSTNPWNQHGLEHWEEITLSTPDTEDGALQLARAALADRNTPKTPGTITVRGYIRDRAGNEQPVWKVRAGDTIAVTNFNDAVRLIAETSYDDETKTVTLGIDRPFQLLDAYLDRVSNALGARGLA